MTFGALPIIAVLWKDKKLVGFWSTRNVQPAKDTDTASRKRKGNSSEPEVIQSHRVISEYAEGYRWVDALDRALASWSIVRNSKRWYMRAALFEIDRVFENMFIICQHWLSTNSEGTNHYLSKDTRFGTRYDYNIVLASALIEAGREGEKHFVETHGGHEVVDGGYAIWMNTKHRVPKKTTQEKEKAREVGRPKGSAAQVMRTGAHRLFDVETSDKFCQVCTKLAPKPPDSFRRGETKRIQKWERMVSTSKGVRFDKKCNLRMCEYCYKYNWDHVLRRSAKLNKKSMEKLENRLKNAK
eukprot:m.370089 g.370089  ORF g.370089 m.370089 type:complete len:298 (-) comp16680_c1_seq39:2146-3039(-)